ncbi:type II toxin-antitoxin system Phd/YefM family antitoxin [Azospirillum rugosum]|uniref:Prevent-host-death family protein n=1 Tax=Azospirillum rugosum TaxID=416170 RepID=A0ABS4SHY6_9PROT|nr:type II toxin-antitoxin system prevent-host-death family antitoxin [Azospirillum rugosum]MBP2292107.1 prevent-host-death family protein [Azospirillum rugosum]MDQ0525757.1 prevent-host-death family protein [Azospirillum rugosum]
MKMLSIEEARDQLAKLVEEAKRGEEVYIVENGTAVLRLQPVEKRLPMFDGRPVTPEERKAAWQRLRASMERGFPNPVGRFSRDEIHEERIEELERRRRQHSGRHSE